MNTYVFIPVADITGSELAYVHRSTSKHLSDVPVVENITDPQNTFDEYLFEITEENLKLTTKFDSYEWYSKDEAIAVIEDE